jgi:hypothetical protein
VVLIKNANSFELPKRSFDFISGGKTQECAFLKSMHSNSPYFFGTEV